MKTLEKILLSKAGRYIKISSGNLYRGSVSKAKLLNIKYTVEFAAVNK